MLRSTHQGDTRCGETLGWQDVRKWLARIGSPSSGNGDTFCVEEGSQFKVLRSRSRSGGAMIRFGGDAGWSMY